MANTWFGHDWRPYQVDSFNAIKSAYNNGMKEQLVVQATGLGKRVQAVTVSRMKKFRTSLFLAHSEELINQAFVDMCKAHNWTDVGIIKYPKFEIDKKVVVASPQSLRNHLYKIPKNLFDLVQIDECFPAGTKIDGTNIEDIVSGVYVDSINHKTGHVERKMVIDTIKNKAPKYLYDFGIFTCTPNHPIYIHEIGYCIAKEIYLAYICHKSMRWLYGLSIFKYMYKLRRRIQSKKWEIDMFRSLRKSNQIKNESRSQNDMFELWNKIRLESLAETRQETKNIHRYDFKRFWLLFRRMQKRAQEENYWNSIIGIQSEACIKKNEKKESNVQSRNKRKNEKISFWKNISFAWRKWKINGSTDYDPQINQSTYGACNKNKRSYFKRTISSLSLQSRFSLSRSKTFNRNRWKNTSNKTLEILRQTKDDNIEFTWLDCDKIQKRRSRSKSTKSSSIDYVYNLEVEGNNNYFANGVLVHNCHRYMAPTWLDVVRHFEYDLRLGWTATPHRLDGLSLGNLFQDISFEYNIDNGIHDGYLCELNGVRVKTQIELKGVKKTGGDFNQGQLEEKVDTPQRNTLIVNKYKEYAHGRQAIAFCVSKKHAARLSEKFEMFGYKSTFLTSDNTKEERVKIIGDFKAGKIDVLCNVMILTEGFDHPNVGCVIQARPTQSLTVFMQQIGRGTRLKTPEFVNKFGQNCIILDIIDVTGKHNVINTWELDRTKKAKDKTFVTSEKRDKLLAAESEREAKITVSSKVDQRINLLKLPKVIISGSPKMLEKATEAQIKFMVNIGVYQEGIEYTKALASEAISNSPARQWEIKWLKAQGYDISEGATIGQYQKAKNSYDWKNRSKVDESLLR